MRVFSTQRAVGRRSRWGEDLGAPKTSFFPTFLRAGFEPRRGRPTSLHFEATRTDDPLDEATRTHGSNPARNAHFQMDHPRRAEIFAPPHPGRPTIPSQVHALPPAPPGSWILAPDSFVGTAPTLEPQRLRVFLHRAEDQLDMFVQWNPEFLSRMGDLIPINRRGERFVLPLLFY